MGTYTDRDLRMLVARSSVPSDLGQHVPLNLAGADLEMATLPRVDFRGADLKGANLRGAMLAESVRRRSCTSARSSSQRPAQLSSRDLPPNGRMSDRDNPSARSSPFVWRRSTLCLIFHWLRASFIWISPR